MLPALYIHIPFCRRKCAYCDFYSVAYDEGLASSYVDALLSQMRAVEGAVSTIFIGGGTPTTLSAPLLKKLLRGTKKFIRKGLEFTVEANPESLTGEKLALFSDKGVNRLSIGIQSFDDAKLKRLGRIHDAGKAIESVMLSRKKGFDNLNIDLIFGAPDETLDDCSVELERAVKLPVPHISCYCLSYEKGSPLFNAREEGKITPADEESSAAMYSYAMEYFPGHGFQHYEISNFAKEGRYCRHNLTYWNNDEYIGLGASAVSYAGGVRKKHLPDVRKYIERVAAGRETIIFSERITGERKARETAAVKIRTAEGINFDWFRERTGYDFLKLETDVLSKLSDAGLLQYKKVKGGNSGVSLTKKGFLFCDTVSSELL